MYSLDVLLSRFGTSLLFHVQFKLLFLDLPTDLSGDRSGGLVFQLFKNFPRFVIIHTVKAFGVVNKAKVDVFLELSCFFNDQITANDEIFYKKIQRTYFSLESDSHFLSAFSCGLYSIIITFYKN